MFYISKKKNHVQAYIGELFKNIYTI